jgi:hypothetical protein
MNWLCGLFACLFMATVLVLVGGMVSCEIIKTVHKIRKDK